MAPAPNFHCKWSINLLVLSCAIFASHAKAQESAEDDSASSFEPALGIELRHDDNIFRSAIDEKTSLITVLTPSVLVSIVPSNHRFEFEYFGELGSYAESSPDDYDDHDFQAGAYLDLSRRIQLDLTGSYQDAHESRGTGLTEGCGPDCDLLLAEPDEYKRTEFIGKFTYGATGTKGRLVLQAGQRELEYKNHRNRTQFFDHDDKYGQAVLYVRVLSNTSLLLDLRATEIEYPHDRPLQSSLNSTEYRYFVGATWDVTGKTTGSVKVGYVEKEYDDVARPKFSDPSWDVDIRWSPRSYSHFDFSTSRYPSEVTSLTGDVIDNKTYSIAWIHEWSERVTTRLDTRFVDQEFRSSAVGRIQDFTVSGVALEFEMRSWLSWEFGVDVSSRDSNIDQFDFDGTVFRLGAVITL